MMEKKNTMLLTVIAVATLLVAVVGATFAYFSLSVSGNPTNTSANVTVANPGSISIKGTDQQLLLKVGAAQMTDDEATKKPYYAVSNVEGAHTDDATAYSGTEVKHTIATAELKGGAAGVTYECPYTVTVTPLEGLVNFTQLVKGDLVLTIYADEIASGSSTEVDLTEISNGAENVSKTGTITLTSEDTSKTVQVSLKLTNTGAAQNYLKDVNIQLSAAVSASACTIKKAGA